MFGHGKKVEEQRGFDTLLDMKRALDREITTRKDREIEALKARINAVADALGTTVAELLGIVGGPAKPRQKRRVTSTAAIQFRNPDNAQHTWSGKGRVPKWLQEKIDQGATKEQFQVQ